MLSSARRRSVRMSAKEGNDFWRVMNWKRSLRPQYVQHQSTVMDGLAKIGKGISHALHLAAVVVDGEGALGESAELRVEEHGA